MLLTNQTWKLETFYHEIAYVVAFMIEPITLFLKKNVTDEYTRAKLKKKKKQFFIHRNFTHWRNQSSSSFYFN